MIANPQQVLEQTNPVARFAQVEPGSFEAEIDKCFDALNELRTTVVEQVTAGNLTPVQGLGWLACAAGQTLGYAEFHGYPSPSDSIIRAQSATTNGSSQQTSRRSS